MESKLLLEDIKHNLVTIKINQSYSEDMSARELYEYTRGYWKRKIDSVKDAEIALSVVFGTVVEVYTIDKWIPAEEADNITRTYDPKRYHGRIAFIGKVAQKDIRQYYLGRDVSGLFKFGEANPVKTFTKFCNS